MADVDEPDGESLPDMSAGGGPAAGGVWMLLRVAWSVFERHGWTLLAVALALYLIARRLRPSVDEWAAQRNALPPVSADVRYAATLDCCERRCFSLSFPPAVLLPSFASLLILINTTCTLTQIV